VREFIPHILVAKKRCVSPSQRHMRHRWTRGIGVSLRSRFGTNSEKSFKEIREQSPAEYLCPVTPSPLQSGWCSKWRPFAQPTSTQHHHSQMQQWLAVPRPNCLVISRSSYELCRNPFLTTVRFTTTSGPYHEYFHQQNALSIHEFDNPPSFLQT
jgi:hypothetical protein